MTYQVAKSTRVASFGEQFHQQFVEIIGYLSGRNGSWRNLSDETAEANEISLVCVPDFA
jgi:hypothetical protein